MTDTDEINRHLQYIRARLDQHITSYSEDVREMDRRLTTVEVKSGIWGVLGGSLAILGVRLWGGR